MTRNELIREIEILKADPQTQNPFHAKAAKLEEYEEMLADGDYIEDNDPEPTDYEGRMNHILRRNSALDWTDEQIDAFLNAPRTWTDEEGKLRQAVAWLQRGRQPKRDYGDGSLNTTRDDGNLWGSK